MPVSPDYCAHCGIRIAPGDVLFGRKAGDERTVYCPACVVDQEIEIVDTPRPISLSSSSRLDTVRSALDVPRAKRKAERRALKTTGGSGTAAKRRATSPRRSRRSAEVPPPPPPPAPISGLPKSATIGIAVLLLALGVGAGMLMATSNKDKKEPRAASQPLTAAAPEATAASTPAQPPVSPEPAVDESRYVGNIRTRKFHRLTCRWAKALKEENRSFLSSELEAEQQRFDRCGTCKP